LLIIVMFDIGHFTMAPRAFGTSQGDPPATLHRVMQTMIAEGLKAHYEPPQKLSHSLLVLLMQIKEQDRRHEATRQHCA
jgi:hypothetical protein